METQDKSSRKDESQSSQNRLNQRLDYKISTNENKPKTQISKIE